MRVAFCKRLEAAIKQASLPGRFANQLAGTFVEMVSNLFEHSDHPETGIVGYKWKQREFEYAVADNGIGLFNSLKTHPDYARHAAVRYTHVAFCASGPATREGFRASPAHGGTRGMSR